MRGSFFFAMGLLLAGCIGIGGWWTAASRGESLVSWVTEAADEEEPVLVLLVGDARGVASVRAAIDRDRILAATPEAFVLREGRVVASRVEAVGEPLAAAGFEDRELELLSVSLQGPVRKTKARKKHSRTAELLAKDTLTVMEAAALLEATDRL